MLRSISSSSSASGSSHCCCNSAEASTPKTNSIEVIKMNDLRVNCNHRSRVLNNVCSSYAAESQSHNIKNAHPSCTTRVSALQYVLNASRMDHDSHVNDRSFSEGHSNAGGEKMILDLRNAGVEDVVGHTRTFLQQAYDSIPTTRSLDSEEFSRQSRFVTLVTGVGVKRKLLQKMLLQEGILFMDNGGDSLVVYLSNIPSPSSEFSTQQTSPLHEVSSPNQAFTNTHNNDTFRDEGELAWMTTVENRKNIHPILPQRPPTYQKMLESSIYGSSDLDKLAIDVRSMNVEDSISEVCKFINRVQENALASGIDLSECGAGMFATIITGVGTKRVVIQSVLSRNDIKIYDFGGEFFQANVPFGKKESNHTNSDDLAPYLPVRNNRMDNHKNLHKSNSFLSRKIPCQSIHSHPNGIDANVHAFMSVKGDSSPTCDPNKLNLSASFTDLKANPFEKHHISIGQHGNAALAVTVSPNHHAAARLSDGDYFTAEVAKVSKPENVGVNCHPRESLDESLSMGCTESNFVGLNRKRNSLFSGFRSPGAFHHGPDDGFSRVKTQSHEEHVPNQTKQNVNDIGHQETIDAAISESLAEYYTIQEGNENIDRSAKLLVEQSALQEHICQENERNEYERMRIAMEQSAQLEALKIAQLAAAEEALVQKVMYQSQVELDNTIAEEEEMLKTAWENSNTEQKHLSCDENELSEEVAQKPIESGSVGKEVLLKEAFDLSAHDVIIQLPEEYSIDDNEPNNASSLSQEENHAEEFLVQEVLGLSLQEMAPRNVEDTMVITYYREQQSQSVDEEKFTEDSEAENGMDNLNSYDRNEMIE